MGDSKVKVKGIGVEPLESRVGEKTKSLSGFRSPDWSCEGQKQRSRPVTPVPQR